jgi:hypothetical protein
VVFAIEAQSTGRYHEGLEQTNSLQVIWSGAEHPESVDIEYSTVPPALREQPNYRLVSRYVRHSWIDSNTH